MDKYGLIGGSLGHSQSRMIHALIGDYDFNMIPLSSEDQLADVLADTDYKGFNITGPYKTKVIEYLDELSPDAEASGSVNVIRRMPDGRLKGSNTDADGFRYILNIPVTGKKCVIFGTGGVALTCAYVLRERGAGEIILVADDPEDTGEEIAGRFTVRGYDKLYLHYDAKIIINATSVGRYPDLEATPLAEHRLSVRMFNALEMAIDLIYNPYRTKFLQDAKRLTGCRTRNGIEMLIVQALRSRDIWLDRETADEELDRLVRSIKFNVLKEQLNVVAVGMPGSGKTTIFRRYAYELGLRFIDTDEETEKLTGGNTSELLSSGEEGVEYYRAMENLAVREISKNHGAVIATGGGTLLNPINRDLLKSNGIVIYMRRPLDMLDIKGRPLSINVGVKKLFKERDRIYRKTADLSVFNSRIFGAVRKATGEGNSYNYELKGFVYYIARKIAKYLDEITED